MYTIVPDNYMQVKYKIEALGTNSEVSKALQALKGMTFRDLGRMIRKYYTGKAARFLYTNIKYEEAIL
jgi:hypothetical protein